MLAHQIVSSLTSIILWLQRQVLICHILDWQPFTPRTGKSLGLAEVKPEFRLDHLSKTGRMWHLSVAGIMQNKFPFLVTHGSNNSECLVYHRYSINLQKVINKMLLYNFHEKVSPTLLKLHRTSVTRNTHNFIRNQFHC